jgi:hypothetical protein
MTNRLYKTSLLTILLLLSNGFLYAQMQGEEFQKLYTEYMEIEQRLEYIQQQAFEDEEVAKYAEEYSSFMDKKLRELDPRAGELIDEREETIDKMQTAQQEGDFETLQGLQQGYQDLSQQLTPFLQQAMEDPEIQEKRFEFEEILVGKMEEIDPETMSLLQKMQELTQKLESLMQ